MRACSKPWWFSFALFYLIFPNLWGTTLLTQIFTRIICCTTFVTFPNMFFKLCLRLENTKHRKHNHETRDNRMRNAFQLIDCRKGKNRAVFLYMKSAVSTGWSTNDTRCPCFSWTSVRCRGSPMVNKEDNIWQSRKEKQKLTCEQSHGGEVYKNIKMLRWLTKIV